MSVDFPVPFSPTMTVAAPSARPPCSSCAMLPRAAGQLPSRTAAAPSGAASTRVTGRAGTPSTLPAANRKDVPMHPTLSRRALGRATLARQLLIDRSELGVVETVEHVVGLQAQVPAVPYLALWNRIAGFTTDDLSAAMLDRSVVRMTLMRGTIHTVSARDSYGIRPWVQPMVERVFA